MTIGEKIRELRKNANLTQTEQLKNALSHQRYGFMRGDPDFIAIADSLT